MMSKCLKLLKIQLMSFWGINRMLHTKDPKEKRNGIGFAVVMALVVVMLIVYIALAVFGYILIGLEDYVLPLMMTVASLIAFVTTIFKANGVLFGFSDYDMVMSLPVKNDVVILSRFLSMYVVDMLFTLAVMIPTVVVYSVMLHPPFAFYVMFVMTLPFIPLIPLVIASVFGAIVTFIASRFRWKSAVTLILSVLLIVGVLLISLAPVGMNEEKLLSGITELGAMLGAQINRLYPPAFWFGEALIELNVASFLLYAGISFAVIALFVVALSPFYGAINTALMARASKRNFQLKRVKASSVRKALLFREGKRYLASPIYVTNTAIGPILLLIAAATPWFFPPEQRAAFLGMDGVTNVMGILAPYVMCSIVGLSCTTAVSISMEGKNLWLLQSLPLRPIEVYAAKIALNLCVTVPAVLVGGILAVLSLNIKGASILFVFLLPLTYAVLTAELGIFINLRFPNLEWTSETTVVKQSASELVAVLVGMFGIVVPALLAVSMLKYGLIMNLAFTALFTAADVVLYRILAKKKSILN